MTLLLLLNEDEEESSVTASITSSLALWVVYGILIDDFVIIWANAVGVVSNIILIGLKIKYSASPFG
jgi:uncharacterized protein with PQ loop repeat